MKIVAISDLHGDLPQLPECDVLVIGGDVAPDYRTQKTDRQVDWLVERFAPWLEAQPAAFKIGIAGNHDFGLEAYPDFARFDLPWIYLLDDQVSLGGVKFYGTPWVPNLSLWAFHQDDAGLDRQFDLIPSDVDVLISHGPPYKYLDFTVPKFGAVHAGAPSMNPTLKRVQPDLFFCGHIHEGYGTVTHPSGAQLYNCSRMTENYDPINPCWEISYVPTP